MTIPTSFRIAVEKDIVNDMAKQSSYAKHANQNKTTAIAQRNQQNNNNFILLQR